MAPKQQARGNMSKFVHQNDAANKKHKQANEGHNGYFEDLKEPMPKSTEAAKTRQPRAQGMSTVQHRVQYGQATGREQVNPKGPFYGTEASSVGDSSETPDADAIREAHGGVYAEDNHATQLSNSQYTEGDRESQEYEYEDAEIDVRLGMPFGGLAPGAFEKMQDVDAAKAMMRAGPISGRMAGDSYPSTTTPPESIREAVEKEPTQVKREDGPVRTMPPLQGPGQQQRKHTAQRQPPLHGEKFEIRPSQPQQPQIQPARAHLHRPDAVYQSSGFSQLNDGFKFYAPGAGPRTSVNVPHSNQFHSNAAVNSSRKDVLHGAAQANRASEIERNDQRAAHAPAAKGHYECPPGPSLSEDHHSAERHAPAKRVHIEQPSHSYTHPLPITSSEKAPVVNQQPQQEETSPSHEDHVADIDYDTAELYDMHYSVLRGQSFDTDPRREAPDFQNMTKDDPIEKRMDTAAAFDKALQHAFLESMPIDEWEQAGDWFLGKFSGALKKLKDVRQEKRKAARQFENEIEMRHVAVSEKRKVTDGALSEIRKSGSLVLEGTPKKAKTT